MPEVQTLKEAIRQSLTKLETLVLSHARPCVRPVYQDTGTRPEQIGTCTFVEIDGTDYLVTAAHVIDAHRDRSLFVGQGQLIPLNARFHSTAAPRGMDKLDFGFAALAPSWREAGMGGPPPRI